MADLGAHVESILNALSGEEAFQLFYSAVQDYGYDNACFTLITDHPSIDHAAMHGFTTNYPDDWMEFYGEQSLFDIDPVVYYLFKKQAAFYWGEATRTKLADERVAPIVRERVQTMMNLAADAGLADGVGIPFVSRSGEISGVGLSRREVIKDPSYSELAEVNLLATVFKDRFLSFHKADGCPVLTNREREVLCWASEGKTDVEIADQIGVSEPAVRFHWSNIFKKLEVTNRLMATTKAMRLNLITLQRSRLL
ncbi:LuxR family transcriptional regulator [Roseibium polysiphoniae]|uniref:LuxR family transcriptional regulator n=1 Tax=Roseibium polysiphoniae TaxID=2571221 RepID=A0A944C5I2_9HYPH|nr:LuxR family transcriptional regulator [Roseibium polysiphoniae]MBS8258671.1 LuxR family transcriptional regulator [Roseibium polysiphoniae]